MNEGKILQMFFDIGRWVKATKRDVLKDVRKDQLIRLTNEHTRMVMAYVIRRGKCEISPPHMAQIPKDDDEFHTVYVNEPMDRVVLGVANDLLLELMPEMLHSSCKFYQTSIGCGKVVTEVSHRMTGTGNSSCPDWKSDPSKYFDNASIRFIGEALGKAEAKYGRSALIDMLRECRYSSLYFDEDNRLQSKYQPLKQGYVVASWLADVLLYDLDGELSQMNGCYIRYSDDMLFIGKDYEKAIDILQRRLEDKPMKLNPKKVEYLAVDVWFKFLGFSIKGGMASLSSSRIKTFRHEIERRTIRCRDTTLAKAADIVDRYLYKGESSWAIQVLPVCNMGGDLNELSKFVMGYLRTVQTDRCEIDGPGYVRTKPNGRIVRGRGRGVKANRDKTDRDISGYLTVGYVHNTLLISWAIYNTLVASLQVTSGTRQSGWTGRLFNVTGL